MSNALRNGFILLMCFAFMIAVIAKYGQSPTTIPIVVKSYTTMECVYVLKEAVEPCGSEGKIYRTEWIR